MTKLQSTFHRNFLAQFNHLCYALFNYSLSSLPFSSFLSISGNEEGGFGWIAFNYLKKVIGPKKVYIDFFFIFSLDCTEMISRLQCFLRQLHFVHFIPFTLSLPLYPFTSLPQIANQIPYAVVEMGGASTQVSQLAPSKAEADAIPIEYRFSFEIEGTELNYLHSVHSIFFMHLLI